MIQNPLISLVMPLRNEEQSITECLTSICKNDFPLEKTELLLIDGMSTDNTRELIKKFFFGNLIVKVLGNPKYIVPTAMNIGIRAASAPYIIRLDAHTSYEPSYIRTCYELLRSGIASNVGGPMRPRPLGTISKVVAMATCSRFGIGNSSFHFENFEGYTETVYLGAFVKKDLEEVGLYDEELVRNQDDELNLRLSLAGKKIYLSPKIISHYHPRDSLRSLWKQYFEYGFWKVRVMQKHHILVSIRHVIPATLVLSLCLSLILGICFPDQLHIAMAIPSLYILALIVGTVVECFKKRECHITLLPIVFACLHLSYGTGFLYGCFKWVGTKRT